MRLALEHHFSPLIAARLRDRGHEVVAVRERAWHELSDAALLDALLAANPGEGSFVDRIHWL